ncbi:hypothetical protein F53441_10178 [Fusarium austroafricanum]|uniref:CBM-cenC domain-containing protein n=1 Tax=Fusarium austroafricanum TaxID=2364996 RepID=A0A8H4K9F0_9HYPO|nr:hypothetical protein F53441_10178 [Fusarium austroafricanum]
MKATRFSLTFIVLALCGTGHASPCKPKTSTTISSALDGTSSTEATLSATGTTSVAESSTTDLTSIISESVSTATATSDAQPSTSTELSTSSATIETATLTTSTAELSSTEILTTSGTETTTSDALTTTTDAATTTTTEASTPSGLFLNPTFDEPNGEGDFDGSPWVLQDSVSPMSVHIDSDLGHSSSHSAYWSVTNTAQNGRLLQTVALEQSMFYTLSYWWYIDEDQQPQNLNGCYIMVTQNSLDGLTSSFPDFMALSTPLPLKTWTKHEKAFNSVNITPARMEISVICSDSAGSGIKVAIDDIQLSKRA